MATANPTKPATFGDVRLPPRFWSKVQVDASGCWLWTAQRSRSGYAGFFLHGRGASRAHRVAFELLVQAIPQGLTLDHLCRVRHCVNPAHLEVVTQKENTLRGETGPAINARKTHCYRGHLFSAENTRFTTKGHRSCRACRRLAEPLSQRHPRAHSKLRTYQTVKCPACGRHLRGWTRRLRGATTSPRLPMHKVSETCGASWCQASSITMEEAVVSGVRNV